ncbi:hypothetical protein BDR07DRAFT_1525071 [Suillus spraguei]|nr:hypothetical protein BDR07DRAFT_1525071 [Suillus spraguei]
MNIPIRLISLSDMKNDVKNHLRGFVPPDRVVHYPWQIYDPSKTIKYGTLEHDIESVWLDTCCVDKSNSTNLDDSVRCISVIQKLDCLPHSSNIKRDLSSYDG